MSYWEVLGIAPTSDPAVLKSGYAGALKRWKQSPGDLTLDVIKDAYQQLVSQLNSGEPVAVQSGENNVVPLSTATSETVAEIAESLVDRAIGRVKSAVDTIGFEQETYQLVAELMDDPELSGLTIRTELEGRLCLLFDRQPPDAYFFSLIAELFEWGDLNPFREEDTAVHGAYERLWYNLVVRPRDARKLLTEHCVRLVDLAAEENMLPHAVKALNGLWNDVEIAEILGHAEIHRTLLTELHRVYDLDEELLLLVAEYYAWQNYRTDEINDDLFRRYHGIYERSLKSGYLAVVTQLRDGKPITEVGAGANHYFGLLLLQRLALYGADYPFDLADREQELWAFYNGFKQDGTLLEDDWYKKARGGGNDIIVYLVIGTLIIVFANGFLRWLFELFSGG